MFSFASADTPNEHDEITAQYCLWYGLNVSVYYAVVLGADDVRMPPEMLSWKHYLEAIGFSS